MCGIYLWYEECSCIFEGNDDITSDFGNVTIHGDDGDDVIKVKGSNNSIYGGNGNNNITPTINIIIFFIFSPK